MKPFYPTQLQTQAAQTQAATNRPSTKHTSTLYALTLYALLCFLGMFSLLNHSASAQRMEPAPKDIQDVTVIEYLDAPIPAHLTFKDEKGKTVKLEHYFDGEKPVLLVFNFFQCPLLCHLILDGIVESLQGMTLEPGRDFELVSVSFDPLDTPTLAHTWKEKYVKQYGKPSTASGWHFLTGEKSQIKQLTDAAGYYYQYVKERQEYAHIAAFLILTPEGKVSRYMYGVDYNPQTLRLSLVEASEGKIGSTLDRIILTCYYYDHTAGRYAPVAFNIMQIGAGLTVIILGTLLFTLWKMEQKRTNPNPKGAQT